MVQTNDDVEIIRLLVKGGANLEKSLRCEIDTKGLGRITRPLTPLMYAAIRGDEGAVKALLQNGASKKTRVFDNFTAAEYAEKVGHSHLAELLKP